MTQSQPTIIFPSEPFEPRQVDSSFAHEREAALSAGFEVALFDHMLVVEGDTPNALGRVRVEVQRSTAAGCSRCRSTRRCTTALPRAACSW